MTTPAGEPVAAAVIVEPAPAKVNLYLHVVGRRADGYHLLDSLVVFADDGDAVTVAPSEDLRFTLTGPFAADIPADGENLVLRARDLLRGVAGARATPVRIELDKALPAASGIGGGSSDAAAALRALSRLWSLSFSAGDLAGMALPLGADLPMCLAACTLRAQGVGEALAPVDGLPGLDMVLVNPGVAVATPAVFAALANRANPPLAALPARPDFPALAEWLAAARNDLEAPAMTIAPEIGSCLAALRQSGATLARMSGSGATCFGLYPSRQDAARAAAAIAAGQPAWYVRATRTL